MLIDTPKNESTITAAGSKCLSVSFTSQPESFYIAPIVARVAGITKIVARMDFPVCMHCGDEVANMTS